MSILKINTEVLQLVNPWVRDAMFLTARLRAPHRIRRSVTGSAFLRRRLVEEHGLARDDLRRLVTLRTPDVLMGPAQRELRPRLMVEERRLPLHAVVTFNTARHFRLGELLPVDVLVAVLASRRRRLEIHVDQPGFEVGRPVAIDASGRTVRSQQGQRCFRVVEP